MQIIFNIFNTFFFAPIVNVIVLILQLLNFLGIPGALGFAIVILTVLVRILIWPFIATQLKSAKKMADLKPHMDELKNTHLGDKQALAKAQMDLYKEHGINPAGGCLPAIIQIPVVIALYQVIYAFFEGAPGLDRINSMLYNASWRLDTPPDTTFLGFNLAHKPSDFNSVGYLVLLVPVITGLLQFVQSKMMTPTPVKTYPSDSQVEKKEKAASEDAMAAVQSQMTYLMPVMVGYFAFSFPVGLAIYWNTFTIVGIIQQYFISGWGGLSPWITKYMGIQVSEKKITESSTKTKVKVERLSSSSTKLISKPKKK